MTRIRTISHIAVVVVSMSIVPVFGKTNEPAQARSLWHSISGWFTRQAVQVEQATQKVENQVRDAAAQVKKEVEKNTGDVGGLADRLIEPVVERVHQHVKRRIDPMVKRGVKAVERHAKPAIERVIKSTVDEVEKQAQPAIARTEKRIQQNIGKTVAGYCVAGLNGMVGFILLRKVATQLSSKENPSSIGAWLQAQDRNSSTLVADVIIGGMLGMGIYGWLQSYGQD